MGPGTYKLTLNKASLTVGYQAKLTDGEITRLKNLGTNDVQVLYHNDATVKLGEQLTGHDDDEWVYQWNNGLKKEDITNYGQGLHEPILDYRITINEEGRQMNGGKELILTDRIETSMELVLNTVKVFNKTGQQVYPRSNDTADDVKVSYDGITRVLTVRVPDNAKYTVEFSTQVENAYEGMDQVFTNTAKLSGESEWSKEASKEHVIQTVSGGHYWGLHNAFTIRKVDGNELNTPLSGAEFTLYKAAFPAMDNLDWYYEHYANYDNDKETVDYDLTPFVLSGQASGFTPVVQESDGAGLAKFENLEMNTLYYWVETKAPVDPATTVDPATGEKYSSGEFAKPQYVILFSNTEENPDSEAHAKLLDHLISDANGVTVNNAADSYAWTATNVRYTQYQVKKIWQDNQDALGLRPASIWVQLKQDGENYDVSATPENEGLIELKAKNDGSWGYTWYDLPAVKADGEDHVYTAVELTPDQLLEKGLIDQRQKAALEEYTTLYKYVAGGVEITNRIKDETTLLVKKEWNDNDNENSMRPAYI